jgi:cell division protein FtsL
MHPKDAQTIVEFATETQKALERLVAKIDEHTDEISALKKKVEDLQSTEIETASLGYTISVAK